MADGVEIGRVALRKLDAIEAELRQRGLWDEAKASAPLPPFKEPFAADAMSFAEWLQRVFLARARELARAGGPFPKGKGLAARAVREYDGQPEMERLSDLLWDFENWVNSDCPLP